MSRHESTLPVVREYKRMPGMEQAYACMEQARNAQKGVIAVEISMRGMFRSATIPEQDERSG